jgi:hypothetical protein
VNGGTAIMNLTDFSPDVLARREGPSNMAVPSRLGDDTYEQNIIQKIMWFGAV